MTEDLLEQIQRKDAVAFTHGGKFHADDVFSAALLLYLNPEIVITRGNRVSENFAGIVFDIGRGRYDHHQKDSRVRENGVPYAAFGLLWEELGGAILGEELAAEFDEAFVQPLDNNDNTGEKNELATLIGNFNPAWDAQGGSDAAFFQAVSVAGMILENKFERYRGNERADRQIEEVLAAHERAVTSGETAERDAAILILPYFIPCQKRLSETGIAFVISPSNRGGYCMEKEELAEASGLESAVFCHKGGFLMTVGELSDAVEACRISLDSFKEEKAFVNVGGGETADELLRELPGMAEAQIYHMPLPELPELEQDGSYGEVALEKADWKLRNKDYVKQILQCRPEAVYVEGDVFAAYPVVHLLRKKHVPVLAMAERGGERILVRIPSGS